MKHTGKGWNRQLRSFIATAATSAEKSVWRDALRTTKMMGEFLTQEDLVPLARGVDGAGKWWGKKG